MSYSMQFQAIAAGGGDTLKNTPITVSGSGRAGFDEAVTTGQTNYQINVAIDVSAVKGFWLLSDQDVLFETNSGSAADDTISLKANIPYFWYTNCYDAFQLGTDVVAVFITNSSGSTANIRMECVMDATP